MRGRGESGVEELMEKGGESVRGGSTAGAGLLAGDWEGDVEALDIVVLRIVMGVEEGRVESLYVMDRTVLGWF